MSFVSTLRQWDEAVAYVEKGDISSALRTFLAIEEKTSKITYNIGCLHLHNDDFDAAEKVKPCKAVRLVKMIKASERVIVYFCLTTSN